jgi:hypothetical protein
VPAMRRQRRHGHARLKLARTGRDVFTAVMFPGSCFHTTRGMIARTVSSAGCPLRCELPRGVANAKFSLCHGAFRTSADSGRAHESYQDFIWLIRRSSRFGRIKPRGSRPGEAGFRGAQHSTSVFRGCGARRAFCEGRILSGNIGLQQVVFAKLNLTIRLCHRQLAGLCALRRSIRVVPRSRSNRQFAA